MKIAKLSIENHSRISDCHLEIRDNLILVGPNGTGKSSILRCLDLLLGKRIQQLYFNICEKDFRNRESPFVVEATLKDLSDDQKSFFPDEINVDDNSITVRMEAVLEGEELKISRFFPEMFNGRNLSSSQLNSIGWKMLTSDFSFKSLNSGRKTIVDDYLRGIDASGDAMRIADAVQSLSSAIEESKAFESALKSIGSRLNLVISGGVKDTDLQFLPGAATESNLLSDVRLQLTDISGVAREVTEQSDGTKSMIAFALFDLLEPGGIVAVDEPETHLHPSAQRNLMRILKSSGRQLIVATHSGVLASEFDPDNVVVTRQSGKLVQPRYGFLQENHKVLASWWISSRIELLTAERIIAVEGMTDRMIVEKVAELRGMNLSRDGIEILEVGGCNNMVHVRKIFGDQGFGIEVSYLVDKDAEKRLAKNFGCSTGELASHSVYVSNPDLEGEYLRAIGVEEFQHGLIGSGFFTENELSNAMVSLPWNKGQFDITAEFCRNKNYKTFSAVVACNLLDQDSALKTTSVMEVLYDSQF